MPSEVKSYSKWGFKEFCNATKHYAYNFKPSSKSSSSKVYTNYKEVGFDKIVEFDCKVSPVQREDVLKISL